MSRTFWKRPFFKFANLNQSRIVCHFFFAQFVRLHNLTRACVDTTQRGRGFMVIICTLCVTAFPEKTLFSNLQIWTSQEGYASLFSAQFVRLHNLTRACVDTTQRGRGFMVIICTLCVTAFPEKTLFSNLQIWTSQEGYASLFSAKLVWLHNLAWVQADTTQRGRGSMVIIRYCYWSTYNGDNLP